MTILFLHQGLVSWPPSSHSQEQKALRSSQKSMIPTLSNFLQLRHYPRGSSVKRCPCTSDSPLLRWIASSPRLGTYNKTTACLVSSGIISCSETGAKRGKFPGRGKSPR